MSDDDRSERFELHDGRILEIRPTAAADGPRLQALFRGLSREDTHRRFFSAFTPRSEWCERWAAVAERGGFGVIALVHPRRGDQSTQPQELSLNEFNAKLAAGEIDDPAMIRDRSNEVTGTYTDSSGEQVEYIMMYPAEYSPTLTDDILNA